MYLLGDKGLLKVFQSIGVTQSDLYFKDITIGVQ